ncbi:Uncharacterised protein [Bordetella pertussis]|nr:Uncharacterised protein [Bordetella pertussis]
MPRLPRSNSVTPNVDSTSRSIWLAAGSLRCRPSAALRRDPYCTTSSSKRKCLIRICPSPLAADFCILFFRSFDKLLLLLIYH